MSIPSLARHIEENTRLASLRCYRIAAGPELLVSMQRRSKKWPITLRVLAWSFDTIQRTLRNQCFFAEAVRCTTERMATKVRLKTLHAVGSEHDKRHQQALADAAYLSPKRPNFPLALYYSCDIISQWLYAPANPSFRARSLPARRRRARGISLVLKKCWLQPARKSPAKSGASAPEAPTHVAQTRSKPIISSTYVPNCRKSNHSRTYADPGGGGTVPNSTILPRRSPVFLVPVQFSLGLAFPPATPKV
jgi:hypothetical protein